MRKSFLVILLTLFMLQCIIRFVPSIENRALPDLKKSEEEVSILLNSIREHIRETPPYLKIQERYQTVRGRDIFSSAPLSFLWQERQTA